MMGPPQRITASSIIESQKKDDMQETPAWDKDPIIYAWLWSGYPYVLNKDQIYMFTEQEQIQNKGGGLTAPPCQLRETAMQDQQILCVWKDLPDVSKFKVEDWGMPEGWGLVTMGASLASQGVPPGTRMLRFQEFKGDDCCIEYFYPIPEIILLLIDTRCRMEREKVQTEIRRSIGL